MLDNQDITKDVLASIMLDHKQGCIDALLMLTESIVSYQSEVPIFQQYIRTLKEKFDYQRIQFIYKTKNGWSVLEHESDESKPFLDADLLHALSNFDDIVHLPEEQAHIGEFDTIIPVIYEGYPIAYSMIEGVYITVIDSVEEELRFLQAYTNMTVIAAENQRLIQQEIKLEQEQKDLNNAAAVQQALVNIELPDSDHCEFDAVYIPHSKIGGDGYDVITYPNSNGIVVTVADVSGKGMPAALLMSHFQAILRANILQYENPVEFSNTINKEILRVTRGEKFISLFTAYINFETKEIQYINFGHNPPFLLQKDKLVSLDDGSTIIGVFDELPFVNVGRLTYEPGDVLFCYTDGVVDTINAQKEAYGEERLKEFLKTQPYSNPKEVNKEIMEILANFKGERGYTDDITLLTALLH